MILILDNYDSFVHTLARYVGLCGRQRRLMRNDVFSVDEVLATPPDAVIMSPGPGTPEEAGMCVELIRRAGGRIPILGVCLGHQAVVTAYGGTVGRASYPMHGRAADITHDDETLFAGIPNPLRGGRYHSLAAYALPECLIATAVSVDQENMAVRHRLHPVWGVQFHPESILTPDGLMIIENFLRLADDFHLHRRAAS